MVLGKRRKGWGRYELQDIVAVRLRKQYLSDEAPVGNGLARSDREAAFGTAYREKHGGICIFPPYPNIQPWFQSGFADGMSKPIPYG